MEKQILAGVLALSIIVSGTAVLADKNTEQIQDTEIISEKVEGEDILNLSNVETYDKDGTKMVPLREVAEDMLELEVNWINETRSVEIGSGPKWTSIKMGENSYFFARVAPFKLSQAPEIKDDLTYVPVEFFSEVLRYEIESEVDTPEEEKILSGFIKAIEKTDENTRILVAGNEETTGVDEILLAIVDETIVVDIAGNEFKVENLKVGTKIKTILPEIMTLSLPPQGTAVKIIVENTDVYIEDTIDDNNEEIKYPAIVGLEETEKDINGKIEEYIKEIKENDLYKDLKLGYEISLLSDEKISIIFNGTFDFNDSEKTFVKSLNFDLKTSKEINFESYFDDSEESEEKLGKILQKTANEQLDTDFEAEGKQIYFRGSKVVVFYYPLDDSATSSVYLYLPLEDVEGLINN